MKVLNTAAGVMPCKGIGNFDLEDRQAQEEHDHLVRNAHRRGLPPGGRIENAAGFLRGFAADDVSVTLDFIGNGGRFWSRDCLRVCEGGDLSKPTPPGCCNQCSVYYSKVFLPRCLRPVSYTHLTLPTIYSV